MKHDMVYIKQQLKPIMWARETQDSFKWAYMMRINNYSNRSALSRDRHLVIARCWSCSQWPDHCESKCTPFFFFFLACYEYSWHSYWVDTLKKNECKLWTRRPNRKHTFRSKNVSTEIFFNKKTTMVSCSEFLYQPSWRHLVGRAHNLSNINQNSVSLLDMVLFSFMLTDWLRSP